MGPSPYGLTVRNCESHHLDSPLASLYTCISTEIRSAQSSFFIRLSPLQEQPTMSPAPIISSKSAGPTPDNQTNTNVPAVPCPNPQSCKPFFTLCQAARISKLSQMSRPSPASNTHLSRSMEKRSTAFPQEVYLSTTKFSGAYSLDLFGCQMYPFPQGIGG